MWVEGEGQEGQTETTPRERDNAATCALVNLRY